MWTSRRILSPIRGRGRRKRNDRRGRDPTVPHLLEVLLKCAPAISPLLPHDDPDAGLQVLAGHAEAVNTAHLRTHASQHKISGFRICRDEVGHSVCLSETRVLVPSLGMGLLSLQLSTFPTNGCSLQNFPRRDRRSSQRKQITYAHFWRAASGITFSRRALPFPRKTRPRSTTFALTNTCSATIYATWSSSIGKGRHTEATTMTSLRSSRERVAECRIRSMSSLIWTTFTDKGVTAHRKKSGVEINQTDSSPLVPPRFGVGVEKLQSERVSSRTGRYTLHRHRCHESDEKDESGWWYHIPWRSHRNSGIYLGKVVGVDERRICKCCNIRLRRT